MNVCSIVALVNMFCPIEIFVGLAAATAAGIVLILLFAPTRAVAGGHLQRSKLKASRLLSSRSPDQEAVEDTAKRLSRFPADDEALIYIQRLASRRSIAPARPIPPEEITGVYYDPLHLPSKFFNR
jgi:hypothetical protein